MRRIPVFKNGVNIGLPGLANGDLIIIEMTHLLPVDQDLVEIVLAYSFFRFEEFRQVLGHLFLSGSGYHLSEDEPGYDPTEVCLINCRCVRRISVFDPNSPTFGIAKIAVDLMRRNKELAQKNAELAILNAQLLASHFNSSSLVS
jgi:hypothetical protein